MNEFDQSETPTPNYRALFRAALWLFGASIIAAVILAFTGRRGWTHEPPWAPPAFIAAWTVYGWLLVRWERWGQRQRDSGRRSLFGCHSLIGATSESHFWLFHTLVSAAACLASGAISNEAFPILLAIILPPLIVPSITMLVTAQHLSKLLDRLVGITVGVPGFVLLTHTFRHSARAHSPSWFAFHTSVFAIGAALLAVMLEWHARIVWREHQTESQTA